jgi:hypothetical protein
MFKDRLEDIMQEAHATDARNTINQTIHVSIGNIEQNFGHTFNIYTEENLTRREKREGTVKSGES